MPSCGVPGATGLSCTSITPVPRPPGVHVVFDPVGGAQLSEALKAVAWGAHYLVIGFASGHIPKVRR